MSTPDITPAQVAALAETIAASDLPEELKDQFAEFLELAQPHQLAALAAAFAEADAGHEAFAAQLQDLHRRTEQLKHDVHDAHAAEADRLVDELSQGDLPV